MYTSLWDSFIGDDAFNARVVRPSWRRGRAHFRPLPAVNVYGDDEKVTLVSEIAGLDPDGLEINVHGRALTLKGTRSLPELGEDDEYTVRERFSGPFERTLTLPFEVDADKVEAGYDKGVLTVGLPRAERDKPRKIEVKVA